MEHLMFLVQAFKDKNVASVTPTTQGSVRRICRRVDWERPQTVVEFGPGTGVFTRYLLRRLHPHSTLIAIELNRTFARRLRLKDRKRWSRTPRLIVEHADARDVRALLAKHGLGDADVVVSGIPFSFLPESVKRDIIRETFGVLRPGGRFIAYQVSFHVLEFIQERFPQVLVSRALLNLPPLCVMEAVKPELSKKLLADHRADSAVRREPAVTSEIR